MPSSRTPAQQATSRANGARSRGPVTTAGNGTRHGLRGGPFALLPGEDREEFGALHAAVTADWQPRDAYERRWVRELVAAMWRQDRLHGLEITTLAAAAAESPPSEATVKQLLTFARYGARIDKDIGRALQALRVLRDRPDAELAAWQNGTSEPGDSEPLPQNFTNELPAGANEPSAGSPHAADCPDDFRPRTNEPNPARRGEAEEYTNELPPRTSEPEPATAPLPQASGTCEPAPRLNRHQRRALAARQRRQAA